MGKENRQYSRVEVTWPSSMTTVSGSIDGEVKNISLDGALILCRELPNLEENFNLDIHISGKQCLNATATTVRLDICGHNNDSLSYGLGIRFLEFCNDSRKLLDSAICHYLSSYVKDASSEDLSRDFQEQLKESDIIVEKILCCFDKNGDFDSNLLLSQTDILRQYHERVFHLLLKYLKESEQRKSRVTLVNCIPVFLDKVDSTRSVVGKLLSEFSNQSSKIDHSDRNMLMLATQLLREYRKEEGLEIETTPEEVLLVQKGLRGDTVELARKTVAELDDQIRSKLSIMNRSLIGSLSATHSSNSHSFPLRFMIALLREFSILMALIGGPEAKQLLRQEALALSNPKSLIYTQPSNRKHQDVILGLLRITIKSYLRLLDGGSEDHNHLNRLKNQIDTLSKASEEARQLLLRRLSGLIEVHLK